MKQTGDGAAANKEEIAGSAVRLLFAPAVWAAHFFAVYLAHTLFCAIPAPQSGRLLEVAVAVLTIIAVLAIGVVVWRERNKPADVWSQASLVAALLAIFATVSSGAAILFVSACGA